MSIATTTAYSTPDGHFYARAVVGSVEMILAYYPEARVEVYIAGSFLGFLPEVCLHPGDMLACLQNLRTHVDSIGTGFPA